jgi:hypothetical protein
MVMKKLLEIIGAKEKKTPGEEKISHILNHGEFQLTEDGWFLERSNHAERVLSELIDLKLKESDFLKESGSYASPIQCVISALEEPKRVGARLANSGSISGVNGAAQAIYTNDFNADMVLLCMNLAVSLSWSLDRHEEEMALAKKWTCEVMKTGEGVWEQKLKSMAAPLATISPAEKLGVSTKYKNMCEEFDRKLENAKLKKLNLGNMESKGVKPAL